MYRISYTFDISRSFVYNLICSRGVAQFGGAPGLGPGGRRFESCHLDRSNSFVNTGVGLIFLFDISLILKQF